MPASDLARVPLCRQWPYGNYFHNITGLNDYVAPLRVPTCAAAYLRNKPRSQPYPYPDPAADRTIT